MNSFKIIKTQRELRELLPKLDALGKPYNPVDTQKMSLHARLSTSPKQAVDEEALDEITEVFGSIIEDEEYEFIDKEGNAVEECVEVCVRIVDLYYQAGCPEDCLLIAELFLLLFLDLESEIEKWFKAAENLDLASLQKIHVIDCLIDSYLKVGHDSEPREEQLSNLIGLSDILEDQSFQKWRLEVDNLRRQLDLCKAILRFSDDEEIKDRYVYLCQDLLHYAIPDGEEENRETTEDAEKFYFIKDITQDKEVVRDYLKYASSMSDFIDEEDLADFDKYLKYLSL